MNRRFDDGYFNDRAEGNLGIPVNNHLLTPTKPGGNKRVRTLPRLPKTSIMSMRSYACPPPTLNSFAAFAGFSDSIDDLTSGNSGYTNPNEGAGTSRIITTNQVAGTIGSTNVVTTPAAGKSNSILDSISGIVQGIMPAATKIGTAYAQGLGQTNNPSAAGKNAQQMMQAYLQGKLPGYEINPQTGQLQPKGAGQSSIPWVPIAIGGALILGLVFIVGGRKSKK